MAQQMVGGNVITIDLLIYWVISVALFAALDFYASKRLGGRKTLGFKALRIPKFISLAAVSAISIILMILFSTGYKIEFGIMTFLGVPYFAMWVFYLSCVLRRIRSEKRR